MTAPSIVASVNAATATQITTPAPAGTGGRLLFIAAHDTGSDEPFGVPNDFGPGAVTDETGHLISHYTAMPAAANVLQVWSKPDSGSEPSNYVLDIQDGVGSPLNRPTQFAVCRVTHPDGVPTVSVSATDVNDAGSSNEPVNPSVTTTDADNLVAYIVGWDEGKTLSSGGAPSGTTELFHSDQSLHDLLLNYFTQATAGATGTGSWNISSGTRWCAATLAFAPPAVTAIDLALSNTLGAFSLSTALQTETTAQLAKTLGALSLSAVLGADATAQMSTTLGALSLSAVLGADATAQMSTTLGLFGLSTAMAAAVGAQLSTTLGDLVVATDLQVTAPGPDITLDVEIGELTLTTLLGLTTDLQLGASLDTFTLTAQAAVANPTSLALENTFGPIPLIARIRGKRRPTIIVSYN
ncbi:hypothetical protein [Mycolicibacterium sp.]|uniref:hypothetical protein n=1 Tax=Mycolicibacterium sp. TaxID=2320850 RepID=UPI00355CBDBA